MSLQPSVENALKGADPARGLEPVVPVELRSARTAALTREPPLELQPARRRAGRLLRMGALATAAVAAVSLAGVILSGDHRAGGLPGTAAAFADEMRAREGILHIVGGGGRVIDTRGHAERFDATEEAWVALDGSGYRMRLPGPHGNYRDDVMDARGDQWRFYSRTGRTLAFPAERPLRLDERLANLTTGAFIFAAIMHHGELRTEGESTVRGQRAYRLVLEGTGRDRYEYDVAIDRVRLLRVSAVAHHPGYPDEPASRLEADITTFEILPDTPANRALIRLQAP